MTQQKNRRYKISLLIFTIIIVVMFMIENITEFKFYFFYLDGKKIIYICFILISILSISYLANAFEMLDKEKHGDRRFFIIIVIIILLCIVIILFFLLLLSGTYHSYLSPDRQHNIIIARDSLLHGVDYTIYERIAPLLIKEIDSLYIKQFDPRKKLQFEWGDSYVDVHYFDYGVAEYIRVELSGGY